MEEKIVNLYEKHKRGRRKNITICVIAYFVMLGIVSMFLGNPFPHKAQILFMETMASGWISTHGYLLIICGIFGILVGIGSSIYQILHDFRQLDSILLEECDTKKYLGIMEYAVTYGKEINLKDFQKSVFMLAQQRYVLALMAEHLFSEALAYLYNHWQGKRTTVLYENTALHVNLTVSFENRNMADFVELYLQGEKLFRKNIIFLGDKLYLEEKYNEAVKVLQKSKERKAYHEVLRQYLLGKCYEKIGKVEEEIDCMKYVAKYGNTMPCRHHAEQYLRENDSVLVSGSMM